MAIDETKKQSTPQILIMNKARDVKNDEFYTCYEDIEKEVSMYDKCIWKDKVIFCNCNDAMDGDNDTTASFTKFFMNNFTKLGLKKLICLHYAGEITILNTAPKGFITYYDGVTLQKETPANFTGSFDDPLSIKILNEEADIVVTNPPFSKGILYWKLIIDSGKKFLIVSNLVVVTRSSYIGYFMNKKVWGGYNAIRKYHNRKKEIVFAPGHWYTNLPVDNKEIHKKIMPLADIPEEYKFVDDTGVLYVSQGYIPNDYYEPIALSVTPIVEGIMAKGYEIISTAPYNGVVNGKRQFSRVLVRKVL